MSGFSKRFSKWLLSIVVPDEEHLLSPEELAELYDLMWPMMESDWTEFDCCECGRHVVRCPPMKPGEPRLCAECLWLPGWYTDPQLADMLDPGYGT